MTSWFASDLHLDPSTPQIADRFMRFLAGPARGARSLFLLGDLFEAWIGDDDSGDPFNAEVVTALRAASDAGLKISVMHGNRDFLLGDDFATAAGLTLLLMTLVFNIAGFVLRKRFRQAY